MFTTTARDLDKGDLLEVLQLCNHGLQTTHQDDFHESILHFAKFIGFEFVLYAWEETAYDRTQAVHIENLSNPNRWMQEYGERDYVESDPVRLELERRLGQGTQVGSFVWDAYDRPLSPVENEIIRRRRHYGLEFGCSAFDNSSSQDSVFLVSFASATEQVDSRALSMAELVVQHLNRCRKRLGLSALVQQLTPKEKSVGEWLLKGKTNAEIGELMGSAEGTIKFHVANLFTKLRVNNRQQAVAVLLAEKTLS